MNKCIFSGRLTKDADIRYSQGDNPVAIARFTLAINRRAPKDGEPSADFISCVAFGKLAEVAEKYYRQGLKLNIVARVQTGSYTNKDGQKVYYTEFVVEEAEFAESKNAGSSNNNDGPTPPAAGDGFMNLPDIPDEEMPPFMQ